MSTVSIGQAAELYGLAPSTLRWWERKGLLGTPGRDCGRRRYREDELRRIGLAYLCCVTGMMSLDKAAVVTSGSADLETWRGTVREEIAELDRRVERMRAARDYLGHLLRCQDDDMTSCRYLDRELVVHTPRGRVREPDVLTAARLAGRDETDLMRDETICQSCGGGFAQPPRGRRRRYCSRACQQRAYRARARTAGS